MDTNNYFLWINTESQIDNHVKNMEALHTMKLAIKKPTNKTNKQKQQI